MIKTKKIKVLHAIRQGKIGGGETHVLDLVKTLDSNLFESVILSFTDGPMVEKLSEAGFKVYVIFTEMPFDLTVWKKVRKLVQVEQIDLIHAHGTRAASNTFFSSRSLKIPLVYTVHGWSFHPDQSKLIKSFRVLSERFLVSTSNRTICVSDSNLAEGKRLFPMKNACVIHNGINRVKFNYDGNYSNIREEFGVEASDILVGYIARITKQKAPLDFIQAIANIKASDNVKFLIVGDGDLKIEMLDLSKRLAVESRIIFVDFREDVPDILSAIDIFCLPSLWEGLPIALLEAMAMKKAVVASNIDGITDIVDHMTNGILCSPSNVNELTSSLKVLISAKALRERLGEGAARTVSEGFNIDKMTKKIESLYNELLNRR